MNLLEHEAKQLLRAASIPVPRSRVISGVDDFSKLSIPVVIKSQVPTGGRGKLGGIRLVENVEDAETTVVELFSTSIKGYAPSILLAEEKLTVTRELYLSLSINREGGYIELVANTNGGVEVEDNDTGSFFRSELTPQEVIVVGEQLAEYYALESHAFILQDLLKNLLETFVKNDATLIEINPLILTDDNELTAGDCKMTLDDAARFRHQDWDFAYMHSDANFVTLNQEGHIATIANGAGLAMATVDAVADAGLEPANFLDIGGGANAESVLAAFRRIMEFPNIQGIVINIFAGITRCDEVAKAIIAAREQLDTLPPLFIRLAGTNYSAAEALLTEHAITLLPTLEDCLAAAKREVLHG